MDSDLQTPGLYTDSAGGYSLPECVAHGYEWFSYQHYNPALPVWEHPYDLRPARGAGFKSVGVWFGTYGNSNQPDKAIFLRDGENAGRLAKSMGADHLHADAELCAKFTRDSRGMLPLIDGIRKGGWTGPVHLNTYGAPSDPKTADNPNGNDFGIDIESFLDTGGGLICQAYKNIDAEYDPKLCVAYWTHMGVPPEKLNVMIEPNNEGTPISPAGWVPLLDAAGVKRNFSIFMAQFFNNDISGLDPHSLRPPAAPTAGEIRALILADSERWLNTRPGPEHLARLRIIHRIASAANTDALWLKAATGWTPPSGWDTMSAAQRIKALLDSLGIGT